MAKKLRRKKSKAQSASKAPELKLKVTTAPLEPLQLNMAIEINPERVDYELRKTARTAAKDFKFPGFREGRAPYEVIADRLGVENLYNEFVEDLFNEAYPVAIEQEGIDAYGPAAFERLENEPLIYHVIVPLEPEVELGDYHSVVIEEMVSDEDVDEQLDVQRERLASWSQVERSSESGDMITVDLKSVMLDENGEATKEVFIDEQDIDMVLKPEESDDNLELALDAALIGLSAEEEKEFVLDWPEGTQSTYAGRTAKFNVKVHMVQAYDVPELDDELALMIDPDCESLEGLRGQVRQALMEHAVDDPNKFYLNQALDRIVEISSLKYPPSVVTEQIDSIVQNQTILLRQQYGVESLESYLEQSGLTAEQYRGQFYETAEATARRNLVLYEIGKVEDIEVTEEAMDAKIQEILLSAGANQSEMEQTLRSEYMTTVLTQEIMRHETGELVYDMVYGDALEAISEELDLGDLEDDADSEDEEVLEDGDEEAGDDAAKE